MVGTAAMRWVAGHILLVGSHELGWDTLYDWVHDLEGAVEDVAGIGAVLAWLVNTAVSALIGLIVGVCVVVAVSLFHRGDHDEVAEMAPAAH